MELLRLNNYKYFLEHKIKTFNNELKEVNKELKTIK
jgi:hypothetical protein